jgi:hypothetical protein
MGLKKKLSSVLGALKKGYSIDTQEGGLPIAQLVFNVAAASDETVLASTALTTAAHKIVAGITNPDCFRGLQVVGIEASVYGNVVVNGHDYAGRAISETILASGVTAGNSNQAFADVTSIILPARTTAGEHISVGVTNKFGLVRPIRITDEFVMTERKASAATSFTVEDIGTPNAAYDTVTPSGTVTVGDTFIFHYISEIL